ncbi:P-loop containing nucleoside triphosphate hydrolase protein [Pavlovales sp. CCMP2436]|nr:P-loop containing nucleoside triphosphate hydrolase protein [Pavlovales sp. CCMP2436]|mmetsp:Transcript_5524/g.13746  ORF Transcript_5524/g.13746 Transcript_5524/m.13746 type:complete len:351 (+) Transcript_5524:69-1121(+)
MPTPSSRALAFALCMASATAEPSACLAGHLLPTVLLVGGQKCGSTSLHTDLVRRLEGLVHVSPGKGISGSGNKEVAYYNNDARYAKGRAWYTSLFPECPGPGHGRTVAIDSTPMAHMHGTSARVYETIPPRLRPQLRIILIVRNPIDRLWSYHGHFKNSEPVDDFVATVLTNTSRCASNQGIDPRSNGLFGALCVPESVRGGLYAGQLAEWVGAFSAEQVALVSFHGYVGLPHRVLSDLGKFIGLPLITYRVRMLAKRKQGRARRELKAWPREQGDVKKQKNPWREAVRLNARDNAPMSQSSRNALESFYAPHNAWLLRMLKLPKYVKLVSSPVAPASAFTLDSLLSVSK